MENGQSYIPALYFHFLTPLYDTAMKYVMREQYYKNELCRIIPFSSKKILDAGCGTGTLTALMKHSHTDADIHGIDIDEKILQIAQNKFQHQSLKVTLHQGSILQLPFESNSFDAAFSCLVLHHLTTQNKLKAIQEMFRVLTPGGKFAIADFSLPHNISMRAVTLVVQYLEETYDNFQGRLLEFIPQAGFSHLSVDGTFWTPMGTVSIMTAIKPID